MTKFVRVKDAATGHHITVSAAYAESDPKRFTALKSDAVDVNGRPLPAKHKTSVAPRAAQESTEAQEAATEAQKEAQE